MRIAVVAPLVTPIRDPQLGGSQAILADLARGLARRGHEVSVFAASGSRIPEVQVVDTGVDPTALASTLYRASGASDHASQAARDAFARTYDLVRRGTWDVVHNHAFDAPAIDLATVDAPVVHTLHLPPSRPIARAICRAVPAGAIFATVSRWAVRAWSKALDTEPALLRNGVPVAEISYSPHAADGVLYAGRLSPEKGAAEAIDIAGAAGIAITVVGDAYDDAYAAEEIEPRARAEGVRLLGGVARTDLWGMMARARAVLCPVAWDEPFGLVAAEAQAAGTPVVAFARGALSEVVVHGATGALVGEAGEAVEALLNLERYDRSVCRRHAERDLDISATLDEHELLYEKVRS